MVTNQWTDSRGDPISWNHAFKCWTCFRFFGGYLELIYLNINLETIMFQHVSYSLRMQFDVNHSERHRKTFVCQFVAVDHHIITFGIVWECANFTRRCLMVNKHGWLKILPWKNPFNSLIMPLHSNSCPLNPSNVPLTTLKFVSLTPNLRSMPLVHRYIYRD